MQGRCEPPRHEERTGPASQSLILQHFPLRVEKPMRLPFVWCVGLTTLRLFWLNLDKFGEAENIDKREEKISSVKSMHD